MRRKPPKYNIVSLDDCSCCLRRKRVGGIQLQERFLSVKLCQRCYDSFKRSWNRWRKKAERTRMRNKRMLKNPHAGLKWMLRGDKKMFKRWIRNRGHLTSQYKLKYPVLYSNKK